MPKRTPSIDARNLDEIVALVYDAALDSTLWSEVVAAICRVVEAERGIIAPARRPASDTRPFALEGPDELIGAKGVAPRDFEPFYAYYHRIDPVSAYGIRGPCLAPFTMDDLLERARLSEPSFERTEIYTDWLRPNGLVRVLGAYVPLDENEFVALGFHRAEPEPHFGDVEKRTLAFLMPHLARALQIGLRVDRLEAQRSAAWAALDELTIGVALVDAAGRVIRSNHQIERLARQADGLVLRSDGVHAVDPAAMPRLRDAIDRASARDRPSGEAVVLPRAERRPLNVLVAPLSAAAAERAWRLPARAIVIVTDPELHSASPPELLQLTYGLTPAEARVAEHLARGDSLEVTGDALGIRVATVRNHLKQVFHKTGTHRQAELVRLLQIGPLRL